MTTLFVKIRLKHTAPGGARTMRLRLIADTPTFYLGRKVDHHGNDDSYMRRDGTIIDRQQFVDKTLVEWAKSQEMDKFYGILVNRKLEVKNEA